MPDSGEILGEAIAQCDRLRALLKKKRTAQVKSSDERGVMKATALAWFNSQKPEVAATLGAKALGSIDDAYKELLTSGDRAASRSKLIASLKKLRSGLLELRSDAVSTTPSKQTNDKAPNFSPLIADQQMQNILLARWEECVKCLAVEAPLAATVMMGGLLEALLLARINRESDKAAIFKSKVSPKDRVGNPKPLNEWTLKNYIETAHEQGWISLSARDVGDVLRDYRNFVHPFKQLSHNVYLTSSDAKLLWEITKNISRQILGV